MTEPKQDFKNKAQRQFAFAVQKQFFPLLIEKVIKKTHFIEKKSF